MGPTRGACVQCGLDVTRCCGHMGYIELNRPIINPIYIQHVVLLLKCFCYTCHRFILNREHMELRGLMAFSGKRRFAALIEYFKRLVICVHCQRTQPDYKISTIDSHNVIHSFHDASSGSKTVIDPQECLVRFENISDDEVRLMGFDPTLVHPKSFIMTRFPVIPTCCRPLIVNEGQCCDDDLTFQQMEIIKNNAMVLTAGGEKYYNNLMFRVSTYFNNTSKKAKHATTGRPIKGIKERIGGKDGYIRNNLLGKRVNQSARTVIGPDPFIDMDTLVVPQIMAQILTIPERVFDRNLELVKTWMESGRVNYLVKPDGRKVNVTRRYHIIKHGDVVVTPNGEKHVVMDTRVDYPDGSQKLVDGVLTPLEKSYETPVEIGDVVHRQLRDGDYVMLNRQPTLHKASMMAMKCKILDIKTLKINLAISKPFNCDFDGDEMNIHVPQSLEARVELELLSRPSQCLISSQASKPNMCIVQDTLSAAYLITKNRDRPLARDRFFQIMMYAHDIVIPIKKRYTFIDIVDAVLPSTLTYTTDDLTIRDGHLVSGVLTKRYLGSTNCSLIKVLNFTYGRDECVKFINNIQ
jgi:DNA-directed RNA polymerase beta' subunit